jgi:hypothetical protein
MNIHRDEIEYNTFRKQVLGGIAQHEREKLSAVESHIYIGIQSKKVSTQYHGKVY